MGFMDIFKPKYKHSDPQIRLQAVKELEDEKILEEIVITDENNEVKLVAFNQIKENKIRENLVEKISNQYILTTIAKNDRNNWVRYEAVGKIENQEALKDIAKNDRYSMVRYEAVGKIENQEALKYIAKNDSDNDVRKKAAEKVGNKKILADINASKEMRMISKINNSCNSVDRLQMIRWINDKKLLLKVNDLGDGIGLLFDIDKLGGGFYGREAFKLFFENLDPKKMGSFDIYDGDTYETLNGNDNEYAISIKNADRNTINYVIEVMSKLYNKGLISGITLSNDYNLDKLVYSAEVKNKKITIKSNGPINVITEFSHKWEIN